MGVSPNDIIILRMLVTDPSISNCNFLSSLGGIMGYEETTSLNAKEITVILYSPVPWQSRRPLNKAKIQYVSYMTNMALEVKIRSSANNHIIFSQKENNTKFSMLMHKTVQNITLVFAILC